MSKKILLVDDDAISLHVLAHSMSTTSYEYETAENGEQAFEILVKNPDKFSVVIADRIMPKLHAIDLLRRMREHPKLKHIPFIMLTGVADKEEVVEAFQAGVADFLYKPVEKELLLKVLGRVCKECFTSTHVQQKK